MMQEVLERVLTVFFTVTDNLTSSANSVSDTTRR